jgi:membrane protein DedA with SNARE-associated domain
MADWIIDLISSGGYLAILALMLLETVFPPIPSELVVPFAGFAAAQGRLDIWLVIIFASLGSVLGAVLLYLVARLINDEKLEKFVHNHGRWLTLDIEDLRKSRRWFDRYSRTVVLFGRLIPAMRSLISIPAGINKMSLTPFFVFSAIGTTIWSAFLAVGGYWLGQDYERIRHFINPITSVVLLAIIVIYLYRLIFAKRKSGTGPSH